MEKIFNKLISFRTISDDQNSNRQALSWIKQSIAKLPVTVVDYEKNGFLSLLITTRPTKTPAIWFQGHLDIVPAPDHLFSLREENGKWYGRGTYDMKFALACYLKLLFDFGEDLPSYDFGIMITTDEEIGGMNGVGALVEDGFIAESCFLPDGGTDWHYEKAAKGAWHFLVESRGKSTHGSRPWTGQNAIEQLMEFLTLIKKEFATEPCGDEEHYHSTISVGKIEGGEAVNKVPDFAKAFVDIRFVPETTKEALEAKIIKIANKFSGISLRDLSVGGSYQIDPSSSHHKMFYEAVRTEMPFEPKGILSHGSSDARFFAERGIPVVMTRPKGGGLHSDEEWIDKEDLKRFYRVIKQYAKKAGKK